MRPLPRVGCTNLGEPLLPFTCRLSLINRNRYAVSRDADASTNDVAFHVVLTGERRGLGSLLVSVIIEQLPADSSRFG